MDYTARISKCGDALMRERRALDALRESAETVVARRAELNAWCAWRKVRNEAIDLDLKALVDGIEKGHVPPVSG